MYKSRIWTYGLQLWSSAEKSNFKKDTDFAKHFTGETNGEAACFYKIFHIRPASHANSPIKNLASISMPGSPTRRSKRKWCRDLLRH